MRNLKRKIYQHLFNLIGKRTPESFRKVRNYLVRNYVKSAGPAINIGRNCRISKNLVIGNGSGVGRNCEINGNVTIGNDVMIGPDVVIYTANHNFSRTDIPISKQGNSPEKPVVIEDNVWIGARVCILPGVTIGEGSVLGACTVVSKDIPPYSVAVGNPARVVKNRKETEQ